MAQRPKSAHYAQKTRNELSKRHKVTNEVKGVLQGEGFKDSKPRYVSRPNIQKAEIQHQH